MRAIIVADGDVTGAGRVVGRSDAADASDGDQSAADGDQGRSLVIAADGGALKALALGLKPDVVVGDADSLTPDQLAKLRARDVEVIVHPADKDESDTELSVREALERGANHLTIVGAFGGSRVEHTIANLLLLTLPQLSDRNARIVDGPSDVRVLTGGADAVFEISGAIGDYVSLLPLTERVHGVTTDGLRYALADATLEQGSTRGLSNELERVTASVRATAGRLAVIHTRREGLSHD